MQNAFYLMTNDIVCDLRGARRRRQVAIIGTPSDGSIIMSNGYRPLPESAHAQLDDCSPAGQRYRRHGRPALATFR